MDIEKMLLYYSFAQLKGVTHKKEQKLWSENESLCSLLDKQDVQYSLFDSTEKSEQDEVRRNLEALRKNDMPFFLDRIDHKEFYRVAYSFPENVMFLDIESTGLSTMYHYITCIGWILDGRYDCWVQGTNPDHFLEAFQTASMIVTFNGTLFDCKFLDQAFRTDSFSKKPHLDLRYFCMRHKLTGGQKEIEKVIGFSRPKTLKETDGKEAIALWYTFLFGKRDALASLIEYNYYDLLGMTYILDWVFFHKIYGESFPKVGNPPRFYNKKLKLCRSKTIPSAAECKEIRNYIKREISNFPRKNLKSSQKYRILGIDLGHRSGICSLVGNTANTSVAYSDEEIMALVQEYQPDLVSIDAPLSLPKGRTSVYDDDPNRSAGIIREAEHELARRGVHSYPALIRSMQELTKRGIKLAEVLRKGGYPVIECFPGAAQDVIQLPRKRTDESLLKSGLSRFGIQGDYRTMPVCHDELDAITASLVGQFFISGYYEPLGIPEENDMIIPQKTYRRPTHRMLIGLAGPVATGKTTAGEYLRGKGYHYIRYSQIIAREREHRGEPASRNDLRNAGETLYAMNSQYRLNQLLANDVKRFPLVVVDGMRHPEDYTFWKERDFLQFRLIYIDSKLPLRQKRFDLRNDESISYDLALNHPAEADVESLKNLADHVIHNDGDLDALYAALDDIVFKNM